jgi:hypothetical protein
MDNRPDIWRRLQDHETTPPQELTDRLLHALRSSTENGIRSLERLQQHATPPPASIQLSIRNLTTGAASRRNGGWNSRFFYGAIAACLIMVAGVALYMIYFSHKPQSSAITRRATAPTPIKPAQELQSSPPAVAEDSSGAAIAVAADATDSTATGSTAANITPRHNRQQTLYIDHHSFPLVDNDLLVTFTSFKYPEMADHVSKVDDKDMKVHLDQYTNIVISKQVIAMIKEMYRTRSNGKPTRKARKMKERLEDWKKADEKHFDSTAFFNAADPIDLAEFILK